MTVNSFNAPVMFSGGVDSTATALVAIQMGEPIDGLVMALPMYDISRGIPFEHPRHLKYIIEKAKPFFESQGLRMEIIRSDKDFISGFFKRINTPRKYAFHKGLRNGWPLSTCSGCFVKRDCKIDVLNRYFAGHEPAVKYIGYSAGEYQRLNHLRDNRVSLLAKYGLTHSDCIQLVKQYGLLSPIYELTDRTGCFGCPNAKDSEFWALYNDPSTRYLFDELVALESVPELANDRFNLRRETLSDKAKRFRKS